MNLSEYRTGTPTGESLRNTTRKQARFERRMRVVLIVGALTFSAILGALWQIAEYFYNQQR